MMDSGTQATAFVVNDDPTQLNILAGLLAKAGIEARAFESAESALIAVDPAESPDLIVRFWALNGL